MDTEKEAALAYWTAVDAAAHLEVVKKQAFNRWLRRFNDRSVPEALVFEAGDLCEALTKAPGHTGHRLGKVAI